MARILVVDDQPVNREFLRTLLAYGGHELTEAADGVEAYERARAVRPDLVVTDLVMPRGDGYDLVRQLRSDPELAHTPVVLYSAVYYAQDARLLAERFGRCRFIAKPAEAEELLEATREMLGQRATPLPAGVPEDVDREHLRVVSETLSRKVDQLSQALERKDEAERLLQRQNERLHLLSEAAAHLLATDDAERLVAGLHERVLARLGIGAWLHFTVAADRDGLVLHSAGGFAPELVRELRQVRSAAGLAGARSAQALCARVAAHRQPEALADVQADPDPALTPLRSAGVRAFVGHPLVVGERLLGVLAFGLLDGDSFTAEDVEFLGAIARYVAIADDRLRLHHLLARHAADLRELNETLEARVAERTAEAEHKAALLRRLNAELSQVEQRERKRIAQVLHDHLQQLVAAAKLRVALVERELTAAGRPSAALAGVGVLLAETIEVARTLSVELSPPVLYDRGLGAALQWLARDVCGKQDLSVDVQLEENAEPSTEAVRALLFQAARELLFNVAKHAGVRTAELSLRRRDGAVLLQVSDQGAGFVIDDSGQPKEGFGLLYVEHRIELQGGHMELETGPGRGTRVTLVVPDAAAEAPPPTAAVEAPPRAPVRRAPAVPARPAPAPAARSRPLRVLLADDHKIVRDGIATLLAFEPDMEVIGQAADGAVAVALATELQPDVVIMDVTMPHLDGVEATRRITREQPGTCVIGLSMHERDDVAVALRQAGARAYLSKASAGEALVNLIRECAAGG